MEEKTEGFPVGTLIPESPDSMPTNLGLDHGVRSDDDPNAKTSLETNPLPVVAIPKEPGILSKTLLGIRKIFTPVTTTPEISEEEVKRIEKLPPRSEVS